MCTIYILKDENCKINIQVNIVKEEIKKVWTPVSVRHNLNNHKNLFLYVNHLNNNKLFLHIHNLSINYLFLFKLWNYYISSIQFYLLFDNICLLF